MAYSFSKNRLGSIMNFSQVQALYAKIQRIFHTKSKYICVVLLLCSLFGYIFIWRPAYLQVQSCEKTKSYWNQVLNVELKNDPMQNVIDALPMMDQLPDIINQCRGVFVTSGLDVVGLNVEQFGEPRGKSQEVSIDYSLARIRLSGKPELIIAVIKELEDNQEFSIYAQEVVLDHEGGEVLLQIYFMSG